MAAKRHPFCHILFLNSYWQARMLKLHSLFILAMTAWPLAANADSSQISLVNPKQISRAVALENDIDKISQGVSECVAAEKAPADKCYCQYPKELKTLGDDFNLALRENPSWKDKLISWQDALNGKGHSIAMPTLAKQLAMAASCEK
ncbi:MAG: hypothetical protein V4805_00365 [Pseudomonadota bacterium]